MARSRQGIYGNMELIPNPPKKTRQGRSENTKLAPTSRNGKRKKYKGQGK